MSGFVYKMKGALALAVCMALFSTTLFADVKAYAAEPAAQTEEEALPELTYEEALKNAKRHSPSLRDIADTADFLQKTKEDLWDRGGYFDKPIYDFQRWVSDGWYAVTSAAFNTTSNMKMNDYREQLTKQGLEATVKNYFIMILSQQDTLELTKKSAELQQKLYKQGKTKYSLGLLSKFDLDTLESDLQKANDNIALLENALDQIYTRLNDLMGVDSSNRYTFVYDVAYEPFELHQTMDQYINDKTNHSYTLKIQEVNKELAKFNQNYLPESTTGTAQNQNELSLSQATRNLKTAKDELALAIRNGYSAIQQNEMQHSTAQTALQQAEADYHKAEVNYKAGNITPLVLEQAQLGVDSAKSELRQLELQHDLAIFNFQNPDLLSSSSGSQGQ